MEEYSEIEKLTIFKHLFKGREDVFALHWQKENKSGYMPAYQYEPYMYRLHKMKGGTFKDYKDKTFQPLTDQQLLKHLNGKQLIGIYPLLKDNTSCFIAADFDQKNWKEECISFLQSCEKENIPAYLERSRSGNGGHVWIFFDQPYPALKSRKILTTLLEKVGIFSVFDKSSSFDRLFPNQDFHSGKGLGNLIALPLNKAAFEKGNSCFINEEFQIYPDQWDFLQSIKRVSVSHLDAIYDQLSLGMPKDLNTIHSDKLHIRLNNKVYLNSSGLSPKLINFLKDELSFANSEYFIKQKTGKNTFGTTRYFNLIEESENEVIIPRGFIGKLIRFCKKLKIDFKFLDKRKKLSLVDFNTNFTIRPHQNLAIEAASQKDFGIITSPPGSGKTIIALKIIAEKKQPTLIVVHRKQLLDQWIERIQTFLGIPKKEIGRIGQGKTKIGKSITIAMIQSLGKYLEKQQTNEFTYSFGTIIIDECHHISAETFRNTISNFNTYYQYGLTATPFRKGNDGKLIFIHLGGIIAEIKPASIKDYKQARIVVRETSLDVPFNPKTDPFEILSKMLVHDTTRNKLIVNDIIAELNNGRKVAIITERKEHIDILHQFLKQSFETITLSGDDPEKSRKAKWDLINKGEYQALITTGQYFGEGTDLQNASCLFLVYPFSFKGKLIQYIGRVQRSEVTPIIYDYRDRKIEYLNRLFLKRNSYYRHLDKQASLFDDSKPEKTANSLIISKNLKVPIDHLDFQYGMIAFKYFAAEQNLELEFEIENDRIRPEFDVLKSYFQKVLKSKNVAVEIFAEFENGMLVAQSAKSSELEKINQEIIESVKFRFIDQNIFKKQHPDILDENLLDINQIQGNEKPFYNSEEELLNDLLKNNKVRHYRQLRYLASKHEVSILKLRFVLSPFSFVFLLSGQEHYHMVLETLDTEEATYIWHFERNTKLLQEKLKEIEQGLNIIRNQGRQVFLSSQPENFSRLIHDYTDDKKGFIIWKDQLEERLV